MKKRTITLISILGIVIITIVILFTTGTLPKNDLSGTIVKTSKYRQQQTKVGDIILSPDVLKDTAQGKQLAINLIQLSYITESIADQTNEIINRIDKTSMAAEDKNEITLPLSQYKDMIVTNMKMMRNSSVNLINAINNNTTEMTEDIDKNFQDIGGFFNRYKTDNNAFTNAIINMEKLVVKNNDGTQEGPSDFEIIRDKLYTVAYQNANFLQEKELKKELLIKIIQETETADNTGLTSDDMSGIVYNDEKKAFQVMNANTCAIDKIQFNEMASIGAFPFLHGTLHLINFCNLLNMNSLLSLESSALDMQVGNLDAFTLQSMAFGSMEKYIGSILMNTDDLKSILSTDQLRSFAASPLCSLSKESIAQLNALNIVRFNSQEAKNIALGLNVESGAKATEGINLVNSTESINLINAMDGMNLVLEVSPLGFIFIGLNATMNEAMNVLLESSALQYMAAGSEMQAVNLTGTFDAQSGIFSQIGLDFLPNDLGSMVVLSQGALSARVSPYINSSLSISF